jgi:hypothetical protein
LLVILVATPDVKGNLMLAEVSMAYDCTSLFYAYSCCNYKVITVLCLFML